MGHKELIESLRNEGEMKTRKMRQETEAEIKLMQSGRSTKIQQLKERFHRVSVSDKARIYNTNLISVLELENLLDLAEVAIMSGLAREESRGAHARRDFPTRDDEKWLKHTIVTHSEDGPKIEYKPVDLSLLPPEKPRDYR